MGFRRFALAFLAKGATSGQPGTGLTIGITSADRQVNTFQTLGQAPFQPQVEKVDVG
jgi:hypothetical protein